MGIILRLMAMVGLPSWLLPLIIAGAIAGFGGWAYLEGRSAANARHELANEKAKNVTQAYDLKAAKEAATYDDQQRIDLESDMAARDMEITEYETRLAKRPDARCSLDDDDVRSDDKRMRVKR
jgi:hypothetical protein